jgi:hypothetical protein
MSVPENGGMKLTGNQREAAVAAIRTCKTREALDEMLALFEITDGEEIVKCLDECMYSPEKFYTNAISPEADLEFTKQIFLAGTWRLNEFYDRMGIPAQRKDVEKSETEEAAE